MMPQETERDGTGEGEGLWARVSRLVESLGNVSAACRRAGVSRSTYYAWKRMGGRQRGTRPEERREPKRKHPHAISADLQGEILALARENPEWGCDRIAYYLKLKRKRVSSPTVQKILIRHGMGKQGERMNAKAPPLP